MFKPTILITMAALIVTGTVVFFAAQENGTSGSNGQSRSLETGSRPLPEAASPKTDPAHASSSGELPFISQPVAKTTSLASAPSAVRDDERTSSQDFDRFFADLESADTTTSRQAIAALFARKRSLSDNDLIKFWSSLQPISLNAGQPDQLRADAIWALSAIGMLAKERGLLTSSDIEAQCSFLSELAIQADIAPAVRRVALKAIGDLHITDGIPVLHTILTDPETWDRPELARAASISMSSLAPEQAVEIVGQVLSRTTNSAIAGTAAYALGETHDMAALPALVSNRGRLSDNLSVDNAIQELSSNILAVLEDTSGPYLTAAIAATEGLWTAEQRASFVPLLIEIVSDSDLTLQTRQAAASRLIDHASHLPLQEEQEMLRRILPIVRSQDGLAAEAAKAARRSQGNILTPVEIVPASMDSKS